MWLFGYLRKYPDYAIKFYHDVKQSPIYQITKSNNIPTSEIVAFSDASWQDCPDTGRSTCGSMIFYQGGIIHARSHVPGPVALSSCKAEYMSACEACMTAAHIRMLLYDYKYLGTKNYCKTHQVLKIAPAVLMVDNQAAVQLSQNDKLSRPT